MDKFSGLTLSLTRLSSASGCMRKALLRVHRECHISVGRVSTDFPTPIPGILVILRYFGDDALSLFLTSFLITASLYFTKESSISFGLSALCRIHVFEPVLITLLLREASHLSISMSAGCCIIKQCIQCTQEFHDFLLTKSNFKGIVCQMQTT